MSLTASPTTNPAVRSLNGEEVPAAGSYALDVSHSQVGFAVRHLMVSKTRGRFSDFAGVIEIAENPLESSVDVTIETSTTAASCPWNLSTVPTRAPSGKRERRRLTCML